MRFLEIAVEHYFEAKKNPDIGLVELLGFGFEFAFSEKIPNSADVRELNYIKKNTTSLLLVNAGMVDFAYKKMESKEAPQEISVRSVSGNIRTFKFSEFLKERVEAKLKIQEIIAKILKKYEFRFKFGEAGNEKSSGYREDN